MNRRPRYRGARNAFELRGMRALYSIGLLVLSNSFMTIAWYGHLRFKEHPAWAKWGLLSVILMSWGIAFFEYCLQVPANRIGYSGYGGPFSLVELKVVQEVITLVVFVLFSTIAFKDQVFRWNHALAAVLLVAAVWLVFKK
jgi:uncharacterized protein (DUF486 family)